MRRIFPIGAMNLFVLILFLTSDIIAAKPPGNEPPLGPLGGRNMYIVHLPWFSFPAVKAASQPEGQWNVRSSIYHLNDFIAMIAKIHKSNALDDGKLSEVDQNRSALADYESTVLEFGADWQFADKLRLSGDWRLHFRYGGFMDEIVEAWHGLFGAPNSNRHYFDRNQSRWIIDTGSGYTFSNNGNQIAAGNFDLRLNWSFIDNRRFALATNIALKLPLGMVRSGYSSGYPDAGFAILMDWNPWNRWAFYLMGGFIFPFDGKAKIMFQSIPAIEFRLSRSVSLLLQMNIQSSPVNGTDAYSHFAYGIVDLFGIPQFDTKFGIKGRHGRFEWEFYVEEDTFTWEGPDILLYFGASYSFP